MILTKPETYTKCFYTKINNQAEKLIINELKVKLKGLTNYKIISLVMLLKEKAIKAQANTKF